MPAPNLMSKNNLYTMRNKAVLVKVAHLALLFAMAVDLPLRAQGSAEAVEEKSVKKGKVLLGTYFSFSSATIERTRAIRPYTETDALGTGINITVGKMLSDHWGLSLIAGYDRESKTTPSPVGSLVFKQINESYSIAPAVRYYAEIGDATWFFVQGGFFVSRGKSSEDEPDGSGGIVTVNLETKGFGVGLAPGISYFMTRKLSTEISIGVLGYSIISGEDDSGNKTVYKTFESLLYLNSVSLGFVYYL